MGGGCRGAAVCVVEERNARCGGSHGWCNRAVQRAVQRAAQRGEGGGGGQRGEGKGRGAWGGGRGWRQGGARAWKSASSLFMFASAL